MYLISFHHVGQWSILNTEIKYLQQGITCSQMGYAELGQSGQGIHLRQFARTFIFVKGDTRIVLVTAEMLAVGFSVRRAVRFFL